MGTSLSKEEYDEFKEYERGDALPFRTDKDLDDPAIAYRDGVVVDLVEGKRDPFKGVKAVRKTITTTATPETSLQAAKAAVRREANILRRARHGHVVNFITAYFLDQSASQARFSIIMDRADGNLKAYLDGRSGPLREQWIGCLINVVAYIHGLGIRHRSISPANVLIRGDKVLLADFGLSEMGLGRTVPITIPGWACARIPTYCAPEVEEGGTRGRSADIFSLGAVFLEMLLAHPPPGRDENYRKEADELRHQLRERTGPNNSSSYALNIEAVHDWMGGMEARLQLDGWRSTTLRLCREMLDVDRDQRPPADDLMRRKGLPQCQCTEGAPQTTSNNLIKACKEGQVDEVRQLLGRGADPNTKGAIHQAAVAGNKEIVTTFLRHEKFSDVNIPDYGGQTVLHCAAGYRRVEVVELLLGWNPEVEVDAKDEEGRTALFFAAGWGDTEVVELLLDVGADATAKDYQGRTALFFAAKKGYEDVVKLLLNRGVDATAKDYEGQTALHFAAGKGHKEVVKLLLDRKADAKVADKKGRTALHLAAGWGDANVVVMLLQAGADATAKDMEDRTALHFAAGRGREEVVKLLLDRGADATVEDKEEQTALDFAARRGHKEVYQMMLGKVDDIKVIWRPNVPRRGTRK